MKLKLGTMFPAPAGMNRSHRPRHLSLWYVPRTRGDEPTGSVQVIGNSICSPHPRG